MKDNFIEDFLKDATILDIDIGCSGDSVRKIIKKDGEYYIKEALGNKLDKEYFLMDNLKDKLPLPEVIYFKNDGTKSTLITRSLEGEMICSDDIFDDAKRVISLAVKGLKLLESIYIDQVPIYNNIDIKLATAKKNIENNLVRTEDMEEENIKRFKTIENAYKYLVEHKPEEQLCFSHGDYSIPNVFYKDDEITGFVDLGDAGIADYWYDIAILVKSIRRNYRDKSCEDMIFEMLGIAPDYEKIEYYILLTELFL